MNMKLQDNEYPYRKARGRWAGGEHTTHWSLGKTPGASCETERVWSSNGKWSGNNSEAYLTVTRRAYKILKGNMIIGGLVTLDLKLLENPREYEAVWAEQSRGCGLKVVKGFLIKGFHVEGRDLNKARKKAAKSRSARLQEAIAKRASKNKVRREYGTVFVSFQDSLSCGNCEAGTRNVKSKVDRELGGNVGAVRADVLLSTIDDPFSRRVVEYAATHH